MISRLRKPFGRFLIVILLLNSFLCVGPMSTVVQAQDRVIIVNAEQPNVWTLEQAHYLLAQMHRRNLDLKAKSLDDLDPNEIAGLRFDVMRMLVEFGATFNQADLATNRLLSRNQEFNAGRREELIVERDRLQKQSRRLTGEIEELKIQKADTDDEEEQKRLDDKIAAKNVSLAKVDKDIEFINDELGTLTAPSGELKPTEAGAEFNAEKLPKSAFDEAFEAAAKKQIERFNEAPKINASLKLENFLQMQYEIIAKQLTLLRDEVGPGERLLFLELPQTVNVAHHEANDKWAQSWWKIVGYMVRCPEPNALQLLQNAKMSVSEIPEQCGQQQFRQTDALEPRLKNQRPITTTQEAMSILRGNDITVEYNMPEGNKERSQAQTMQMKFFNKFVYLDKKIDHNKIDKELKEYLEAPENSGKVEMTDRQVRTVDLIPRQSSINVNDMKLKVRSGAFNFVLSTLFGFGSQLNVQRQREQFSQFVQQELYSAAFGKGSREFGWTFTPMPGTDRLMSGVRTTYAVVVVPEEATSLVVESNGCYFPRSAYQPNNFADTKDTDRWGSRRTSRGCADKSKAFVLPIPSSNINGSNDFWVEGISFQPVNKGERIVVLISGKNFSSQIGVLVNGVSLIHAIGLAQPLIRDDSNAGKLTAADFASEKINGRIERVDKDKIVISVKMPDNYTGTPTITLIAPGRAVDINWLPNLYVNGRANTSLIDYTANVGKMFKAEPGPDEFRIDSIEAFRLSDRKVAVLITGAGFATGQKVYVNGVEPSDVSITETLVHVKGITAPSDEKIQVVISAGDKTIKSAAVVNPAQLKIDKVTVVSYEAAKGKQPGVLVVRLDGSGFASKLEPSKPRKVRVDVTSSTEAFLTITNPDESEVVTLTDPDTKISVSTVVVRKPQK